MKHTIDARDQKIGRIASQAASILMGKNLTTFAKNTVTPDSVTIVNAKLAEITATKKAKTTYVTYTGYRGGLNKETLSHLIERSGYGEVLRRAIYRMLPDNKLRSLRMKKLIIKE